MSNEEFDRRMEFFLEQQARFDANLARQQARSDAFQAEQEEHWAKQRERNAEFDHEIKQLLASLTILRDAIIGLTHRGTSRSGDR